MSDAKFSQALCDFLASPDGARAIELSRELREILERNNLLWGGMIINGLCTEQRDVVKH
jgi:hypothetical protein